MKKKNTKKVDSRHDVFAAISCQTVGKRRPFLCLQDNHKKFEFNTSGVEESIINFTSYD